MCRTCLIAVRTTVVTLLLTGLLYPLGVTGLARVFFPEQAGGSLVRDTQGAVIGSKLIAQPFARAAYFQPRPSAAGEKGWDAQSSGGSNLGPTSAKLRERVRAQAGRLLLDAVGDARGVGTVPGELVAASASGLDPHISPGAARWQLGRVARARGLAAERVVAVLAAQVEGRDLGFLGEPRVNVLLLNMALDRQFGRPATGGVPSAGAGAK